VFKTINIIYCLCTHRDIAVATTKAAAHDMLSEQSKMSSAVVASL